jgi:hypothetical protein
MNGDKLIRAATALVVITVALFAAIVSYSHAYDLGRTHGQSGVAARLLPLSIDGLILAGSLILLHEARNQRPGYWLARLALWLGIAATLGANVAYGAAFGPLGALLSGWPAVSFIISTEALMGLVRRARGAADVAAAADVEPGPDVAGIRIQAVLDAAESDAARVRFAVKQTGRAEIAPVSAWLAEHGHAVDDVNIVSVLRRLADKPVSSVNGSNGHNGHIGELAQLPA